MSNPSQDDLSHTPDAPPEKSSSSAGRDLTQKSTDKPAAAQESKTAESEAAKPKTAKPKAVKPETAAKSESTPAAPPSKPASVQAVSPAKPESAQAAPPANVALVVDDEPANRDFLMRLLEQTGLQVKGASDGKEALDIAQRHDSMALLAIDHKLPDMDGVDLLHQLRERFPAACVVMATMLDERALMAQAFENGCNVFLVKPHGFMELFRHLQEKGPDPDKLDRLVIDQYGLRPYRG